MFINVNDCFLVTKETHASSRLGEHGFQDRLCKIRIPRPNELMKTGSCQLFFPHTNYFNVRTIELYLVGRGQEKY